MKTGRPVTPGLDAGGMRIALLAARFNADIVDALLECSQRTLVGLGADPANVVTRHVPGAYELPLAARALARTGAFDGIVALGAVIRGETPHFDFVAGECARGLMDVQLATGVPVGFGVITADTPAHAQARAGGAVGNKGEEATLAVVEMIAFLRGLRE